MSTIPGDRQEEIEELIKEATVDCYGEEEEFTGIITINNLPGTILLFP
jgi:hypothetical protein